MSNTLRAQLSARLRELMNGHISANTETAVALRAGVGQASVNRILNLKQAATVDVIEKVAPVFDIKPAWLMLTKEELNLLQKWDKSSQDDKEKVLGYLSVVAGVDSYDGGSVFNKRSATQAATIHKAAFERAGAGLIDGSSHRGSDDRSTNNQGPSIHSPGSR